MMDTNQDKIFELNQLANRLYKQGNYADAVLAVHQIVQLTKELFGENHPDYATSLDNLATVYKSMRAYDKAEPLLIQALQIRKKAPGENHPDYATSLNNLATVYYSLGPYDKAEPLLIQALQIRKKVLGENHPDYANSLNNLAALYYSMGAFEKAESFYTQAFQIRKKALGETHPDYATSLDNLAGFYKSMGAYDKAEPLLIQVLQIRKKALGENHPNYATSLNQLAMLYYFLGAYEKAEPLYIQALQIQKKALGETHPDYATSLNNLATLYTDKGAFDKAEPLLIQALQIRKKALGENHPDYANGLNNLAALYFSMGAFDKAEPLLIQALQIRKKALGENHPNYATSLNNLATCYKSMGVYDKAEPLYNQALQVWKKTLGENHPNYAAVINNLATVYYLIGAYDKAEPLLIQALQIQSKALGENHPDYAASLNNLALVYKSMGVYDKVESLYTQALQIRRKALGENHPDYAASLNNLAGLYYDMEAYDKAEPLYNQALQVWKKALGENHPGNATSLNNLATCYKSMGAYDKAEPLYNQALQVWKKTLGENHPGNASSLNNLAILHIATNRINDGFALMKEAMIIDDRMIGQIFSFGSEDQRLTYLSLVRPHVEIFISLVFQHFLQSPAAIQDALALIQKRKAISAEALAAQRDAILGGKHPHLREMLHQLTTLRMQIAQKTLAGPGKEGSTTHLQNLAEWNAEKERLETELARQIPEIRLEQNLRNADRIVIAHTLPPNSALLEFLRFNEFDFSAIHAKGEREWKPARYCAFVMKAGNPDNVSFIDLGEAEQIDRFIALYKSKLTGEGRALPDTAPHTYLKNSQHEVFSRLPVKKTHEEEEPLSRDLGAIAEQPQTEMEGKEGLQLYSALIAPLQNALGDCLHLIVAPDSQISTVPFEVIPIPDGGYLIDRYHLSYVGVGRDVLRFAADIQGTPGNALVMASPDFDLSVGVIQGKPADTLVTGRRSRDFSRGSLHFSPLPGTKVEGKNIGTILGVIPLLEQNALEAKLKSVSSPLILHVATHGFFLTDQKISDPEIERNYGVFGEMDLQRLSGRGVENPMLRSGLALAGVNTWLNKGALPTEAEDGILTAEDVSGLDLTNTALAVLSACDTGMGDVKTGEGVFGLRRAFALAGAKTLVMSLWKVPDTPTQELMEDFYRRLLKGTPKADALREAQLEIRKKYPHPRDWGAFICQGDPGPVPFGK